MAPGVRDPAGLVDPENPAALDLVGPEDMSRVDPADMSQVGPAAMADTVRVDLASLGARVGREDMSPEDPVARVDLAERVLTARERRGLEAQVLNPDRARRDPMPTALDRAHPDRMRAHLDPMPADRLWDPTTRAEATRPEARIRLVEATPRVETAPRVVATHSAELARSGRTGTVVTCACCACSAELSGLARITDRERLRARAFHIDVCGYPRRMKKIVRMAATAAAIAGLGLVGLGAATDAQAQPGPFPQWCPGEFWDQGWGDNWDWGGCHDNFRGAGGPGWDNRGGPGWDHDHGGPGGPGWDHDHGGPGWDNHGGPGWDNHGPGGPEGHR